MSHGVGMMDESLSRDDGWLLQLFVLIRAAREPVSEEALLEYAERHRLHGITASKIRRLLSGLVRKGFVQT